MKITKLTKEQMTQYKAQTTTRRQRENKGGYEYIIEATDQDLD